MNNCKLFLENLKNFVQVYKSRSHIKTFSDDRFQVLSQQKSAICDQGLIFKDNSKYRLFETTHSCMKPLHGKYPFRIEIFCSL